VRAAESAAGIEAFCRGAGIDAKAFSEEPGRASCIWPD
jgi:hypothetical protein